MQRENLCLVRTTDETVLLTRLRLATTFWSRLQGLQFRPQLEPECGLLLSPCSSLHTCLMRFPIDVVMLDRCGVVLGVRRDLRPWRVLICEKRTQSVIETATGVLELLQGETLAVRPQIDRQG